MNSSQGRSSFPPARAFLALVAIVVVVVFWRRSDDVTGNGSPNTLGAAPSKANMASQQHPDALTKVNVDIKQTQTSPPTLSLTVTNNYDEVMTFLTWDSPLDPAAVALGLISITPEGASSPLDLPQVAFRRVMPPPPENLVTLQPGQSETAELVLKEPAVPVESLVGKARVSCKGSWSSVWPGYTAEQLTPEILDKLQYGDHALSGSFETKVIDVTIE